MLVKYKCSVQSNVINGHQAASRHLNIHCRAAADAADVDDDDDDYYKD